MRSIRRGLGPAGLKDSFDVSYLSNITHQEQPEPFSVENPVHMLDVVVLGLWFMLREAEIAAARLAHLTIDSNTVSLLVPVHTPVHKTDQVGSLSMRQLNCACRYRRHHLCPWHSAFQHLKRVRLHGRYVEGPSFPLVPDEAGLTPSKYKMIQHIRLVLQTAGIAVQLLGRWSSQAVQRYVQTSHLSVVPNLPAQLLGSRPPELLEDSGLPAPGEGTLHNGLLQHRKRCQHTSSWTAASQAFWTVGTADTGHQRLEVGHCSPGRELCDPPSIHHCSQGFSV